MIIMVFDVAAENSGALSVLNDFYNEYKVNQNINYIFVISKPKLEETNNISVLRYPWIKKSWFHRIVFDNFVAPRLVRKYEVDEILSLQNIIIPRTKKKQTVYIHNSLPFVEHRFSILEDKLLWVYQNIISRSIFKAIKKANKIIVQTEWMKKACIEKVNVDALKIDVIPPKIEIDVKGQFNSSIESTLTFFYPASGVIFKNHRIIVDASLNLKNKGIDSYNVVFTLIGNENKNISELYRIVRDNKLPISFVGSLSREEVFKYYLKSTLLFPSYIETVGLPLIEAKMHKTPIISSDCAFSHEVLLDYENVIYFDPFNTCSLEDILESIIVFKHKVKIE